jgi:hypothetical protein
VYTPIDAGTHGTHGTQVTQGTHDASGALAARSWPSEAPLGNAGRPSAMSDWSTQRSDAGRLRDEWGPPEVSGGARGYSRGVVEDHGPSDVGEAAVRACGECGIGSGGSELHTDPSDGVEYCVECFLAAYGTLPIRSARDCAYLPPLIYYVSEPWLGASERCYTTLQLDVTRHITWCRV